MRAARYIVAAAALLLGPSANAQVQYPVWNGATAPLSAPGYVRLCPAAGANHFIPCDRSGAVIPNTIIANPPTQAVPIVPVQPPTVVTAVATGTTAAVTATLSQVPNKTLYLCGFSVTPGSATTAINITVTATGLLGGTITWTVGAPATAAGATGSPLTVPFNPCPPASSQSQTIAVVSGALGTGGAGNDVNVWGVAQ
jgi:hypothetical protein